MPTYQYQCTDCGSSLEVRQSFSDEPLTVCPECEGRLRKVFNAVGVVFKGSGFYRTDSRASNGDGAGNSKDPGGAKEKKDAKEPAPAKATNGSGSAKQPATSGATSTGGSSPT